MTNASNYFPTAYKQPIGVILAVISIMVLCTGIWLACLIYRHPKHPMKNLIIILWALLPPIYFLFNYYILFRFYGYWYCPDSLSHYKYSQGLYTKLWAAIFALLAMIASGKLNTAIESDNEVKEEKYRDHKIPE